ncbi:MAG: Rrf2 family transcriptional regulator [Deltaproteobacteria bacterium]|nr:Rrf2 family transcriptional regulator [Deltaproteobacteria bacterium]
MLSIKRETDYAVRTVLHLASVEEEARPQVRDVAALQLLPLSFIRRIVARLSSAGILATTRGMGGGIRLARPASQISLLDVVNAMEDGIVMNQCLDERHSCPLSSGCPAQMAWAEATVVLETHLAGIRFDALASSNRAHTDAHREFQVRPAGTGKPARPIGTLPVVKRR